MKIGILCKDFSLLKNWELRIIDELINNPSYSITLIIKDGRKYTFKEEIITLLKTKNKIAKIVLSIQSIIERKLFPEIVSVDKTRILDFLCEVKSINLNPVSHENVVEFSKQDANSIKKHELDVIIKLEFNTIQGDIIYSAKHGIWNLYHSDFSINRSEPIGFWETINKQPVIGVTLQRLTSEGEEELIIDKGFYSSGTSFIQSGYRAKESSLILLLRNLKLLAENNSICYKRSEIFYNKKKYNPTLKIVFRYIYQFHLFYIYKKARTITNLGLRPNCWAIFSSSGNIFETKLVNTIMVKPNKDEFWADPFTYKYNNITYLFFENFDYKLNRAKISCGILENNEISQIIDVLVCNYHLSYPYIIENNNEIFMIPETHENKRLEVYKSIDFPLKWELYSTGFDGEALADATIYRDTNDDLWLFVNKGTTPLYNFNSELYIYKIDSLKLNSVTPHKKNPVIVDSRIARNGGSIFRYKGDVIRPSQNNSYGIYGYGLNLSVIKKLTLEEYEEELLTSFEPKYKAGLKATHHLCQTEDGFVIDGCFNYL